MSCEVYALAGERGIWGGGGGGWRAEVVSGPKKVNIF